jgi:uncharacterized membrane protein YtjA (UPF0391 family)
MWHLGPLRGIGTAVAQQSLASGCSGRLDNASDGDWPAAWRARGARLRAVKETIMLTTLAASAFLAQMPGGLIGIAIIFFIIALVAYVLGARGVAGMSAGIGRTLLFVFLVLAVIMVIVGLVQNV